jgi:hypothetical protein
MRVKCIANKGRHLSDISIKAGQLETTKYPLKIGDIYTVYGIIMWKGAIEYLTLAWDQHFDIPDLNPAELFEVVDSRLPHDWYFKFYGYGENDKYFLNAIWGYEELVLMEGYLDKLLNREDTFTFIQRKKEIDEFHNKEDRD